MNFIELKKEIEARGIVGTTFKSLDGKSSFKVDKKGVIQHFNIEDVLTTEFDVNFNSDEQVLEKVNKDYDEYMKKFEYLENGSFSDLNKVLEEENGYKFKVSDVDFNKLSKDDKKKFLKFRFGVHIGAEVYGRYIKDIIKSELVSSVSNKEKLAVDIKYKIDDEDYFNKCYSAEELVDLINLSHTWNTDV